MPRYARLAATLILCLALAACAALEPSPRATPSGARPGRAGTAAETREPAGPQAPASAPRLVRVGPAGCNSLARGLALSLRARQGAESVRKALAQSLAHVREQPPGKVAALAGNRSVTYKDLDATLNKLDSLLPSLAKRPGLLCSRFAWYRLDPDPQLTAYYTPRLAASAVKTPAAPYPLYAKPPGASGGSGLPDRAAIDFGGALDGQNLELAWVGDRVELFNMHVQGSGVLVYPDGRRKVAVFAGSNKLPFKGLGRMLLDGGHLSRDSLAWEDVQAFFAANPDKARTILSGNRSYVFFALRDQGPVGAMGKPLTPLVSLATDRNFVPSGAVVALSGALIATPEGRRDTDLLCLAQDAGAAIVGPSLDLYAGEGPQAAYTARRLKQPVKAYLLLGREK